MTDRDDTCLPEVYEDPYEAWLKRDIESFESAYGVKL